MVKQSAPAKARRRGRLIPAMLVVGALLLALAAVPWRPTARTSTPDGNTPAPPLARVKPVIEQRCAVCHAARPVYPGLSSAPLGVKLETEQEITALKGRIRYMVINRTMPPGNLTHMTDRERELLDQWGRR